MAEIPARQLTEIGDGYGDPPDGHGDVFIQWKGTDVCLDFWCACGTGSHFDGYFAHVIECRGCGRKYRMPWLVRLEAEEISEGESMTVVPTGDDD